MNNTKTTINEFYDTYVKRNISQECRERFRDGTIENLKNYFRTHYAKRIIKDDGNSGGEFIIETSGLSKIDLIILGERYLRKQKGDLSAKDLAKNALESLGMPPMIKMSTDSLKKVILTVMQDQYLDKVYVRIVQGGHCTYCLSPEYCEEVLADPRICGRIETQIKRANKTLDESGQEGREKRECYKQKEEHALCDERGEMGAYDNEHGNSVSSQGAVADRTLSILLQNEEFLDSITDSIVARLARRLNAS